MVDLQVYSQEHAVRNLHTCNPGRRESYTGRTGEVEERYYLNSGLLLPTRKGKKKTVNYSCRAVVLNWAQLPTPPGDTGQCLETSLVVTT